MPQRKVILGFSGGVDSTASAIELRNRGYDVLLETLDTTGDERFLSKAREVALKIDMPLHITDVKAIFRRDIIDYFIKSYIKGRTPAPCTLCNVLIKWKVLYDRAVEEGCDHIATGHYFRIAERDGLYYVRKGVDPVKDQSYYLWALPQNYLSMALTPMGDMIKSDVKNEHNHIVNAAESMGVCFLRGVNYADFLRENVKGIVQGDVVDRAGNIVGCHDGCAFYTTGQKKRFECSIAGSVVVDIDAANNRLVVGTEKELYSRKLYLKECVAADIQRLVDCKTINVKIRGFGFNPQGYAKVSSDDEGKLTVELTDAAYAPAKGQPVVLYNDDIVVGGGFLADYD